MKSTGASVGLAVKNFEEQVASDPDTADKFFWLGDVFMVGASAQKDPTHLDRAIGFFEEALKIDPIRNAQVPWSPNLYSSDYSFRCVSIANVSQNLRR